MSKDQMRLATFYRIPLLKIELSGTFFWSRSRLRKERDGEYEQQRDSVKLKKIWYLKGECLNAHSP